MSWRQRNARTSTTMHLGEQVRKKWYREKLFTVDVLFTVHTRS